MMTKTADGVEFELGETMLWYMGYDPWFKRPYLHSLLVGDEEMHPWVNDQSIMDTMYSSREAAINAAIKNTDDPELISIYKMMLKEYKVKYNFLTLRNYRGFFIGITPDTYIGYAHHPSEAKKFHSMKDIAEYLQSLKEEQRDMLLKQSFIVTGINKK